jgi:hypothetical protein
MCAALKAKDSYSCERCDRPFGGDKMKRRLKNKLWISVALIAVLAGGTAAAVMAAQPAATHIHRHHQHHREGGMLAAAASYLGSTPSQLKSELQSGKSLAEIANATSGKSEAGLIATLEAADKQKLAHVVANLPARITATVDRPGGGIGAGSRAVQAATSYLGISVTQLCSELRSGKTLAEIAKATNSKSEAGLMEALVAARKAELANAVRAGSITQAQANADLAKLASRVAARVNRAEHRRGSRAKAAARAQRAG